MRILFVLKDAKRVSLMIIMPDHAGGLRAAKLRLASEDADHDTSENRGSEVRVCKGRLNGRQVASS